MQTRPANKTNKSSRLRALLLCVIVSMLVTALAKPADAAPPPSGNETASDTPVVIGSDPAVIYATCSSIFSVPVVTQYPLTQRHCDALEAIYYSTGGPNWTYDWHPGAVPTTDPCTFTGVWCDPVEGIFRLELAYNNLVGAMPAEIGDLENLTWLSIYSNSLTSLPPQIGHLKKLVRLTALNNQLTALPAEIGSLTSLELLSIGHNQLNALPSEINNLTNLRILRVDNNQITYLPALSNLVELTELSASFNHLVSLPSTVHPKLTTLYLDSNDIGGHIAPVVTLLTSMPLAERIGLGNNDLYGKVPATITTLPLVYVELSGNGCLTADAATTAFLSGLASFTGSADDGLNIGCPKIFSRVEIRERPFALPYDGLSQVQPATRG